MRAVSDGSYVHDVRAFSGIGLRPFAPAHLRSVSEVSGDRTFSWVRRTRVDGDSWASPEVPLGEAYEAYVVRVFDGVALVRSVDLAGPGWVYTAAMQTADGISGSYSVEVAQISERFGAGSFARIEING